MRFSFASFFAADIHTQRMDTRGASLVEYIILVGTIALVAVVGFRRFGSAVDGGARRRASCVTSLAGDCGVAPNEGSAGTAAAEPSNARRDSTLAEGVRGDGASAQSGGQHGAGYWIGHVAKGFGSEALETVTGLGKLAFDASLEGHLYTYATGKRNSFDATVSGLGKYAFWASPPGQLITAARNAPRAIQALRTGATPPPYRDPARDMERAAFNGIATSVKNAWRRDKADVVGRGLFEVATIVLPAAKVATAGKAATVAEVAAEAGGVADVTNAVEHSEQLAVAADRASSIAAETVAARSAAALEQTAAYNIGHEIPAGTRILDGFLEGGRNTEIAADGSMTASAPILVVDRTRDAKLAADLSYARSLRELPAEQRAQELADYVDRRLRTPSGDVSEAPPWENDYVNQDVLLGETGDMGGGNCRVRALYYKVVGDEAGLDVSLQRGAFELPQGGYVGHAWNDVALPDGRKIVVDTMNPNFGTHVAPVDQAGSRYVQISRTAGFIRPYAHPHKP